MNQYSYKEAKRLVFDFDNDTDKEKRTARQECKHCTYVSMFSGQAFTSSNCISCGVGLTHHNTDVDVLCLDCAKSTNSCKHCGGALD